MEEVTSERDHKRPDRALLATHIKLICWERNHEQYISRLQLRLLKCAPVCTAPTFSGAWVCGSPIWAVQHEDEPKTYVGQPPHENWERWADCIPEIKEPE